MLTRESSIQAAEDLFAAGWGVTVSHRYAPSRRTFRSLTNTNTAQIWWYSSVMLATRTLSCRSRMSCGIVVVATSGHRILTSSISSLAPVSSHSPSFSVKALIVELVGNRSKMFSNWPGIHGSCWITKADVSNVTPLAKLWLGLLMSFVGSRARLNRNCFSDSFPFWLATMLCVFTSLFQPVRPVRIEKQESRTWTVLEIMAN